MRKNENICARTRGSCNNNSVSNDGCAIGAAEMPSLAMVYTPYQNFCALYSNDKGFSRGTIFSQLDKPFTPGMGKNARGGCANGCRM